MPPKAKNTKPMGVTRDQFAAWMGRGRHAVYEWERRGGVVSFPDGTVDPIASCRAVDRMLASNAAARKNNPENTLTSDDLTKLPAALMVDESLRQLPPGKLAHLVAMYRAEEARLELERGKGTVIEVSSAAAAITRALEPAISGFKGLPYQAGPLLVGLDDQRRIIIILEQVVNDVLRNIAAVDPVGLLSAEAVSSVANANRR